MKTLTPQLKAAGWRTIAGHLRPPLSPALEGWFWLALDGAPPTVTHQDKEIGRNFKTGKPTLRNNPGLVAAWDTYLRLIPERRTLVPLAGPVKLWVVFNFPAAGPHREYHTGKPDVDNSLKVLIDCLVLKGFLVDDAQIVWVDARKRVAGLGNVYVCARSLDPAGDTGHEPWASEHTLPAVIYPVAWKIDRDVAAVQAPSLADRAARIGTPGGTRKASPARPRQKGKRGSRPQRRGTGSP